MARPAKAGPDPTELPGRIDNDREDVLGRNAARIREAYWAYYSTLNSLSHPAEFRVFWYNKGDEPTAHTGTKPNAGASSFGYAVG